MTDEELHEFLDQSVWTMEDRAKLCDEWNSRRGDKMHRIGLNHVRTSCRLRNVVGSFKHFLIREKDVH